MWYKQIYLLVFWVFPSLCVYIYIYIYMNYIGIIVWNSLTQVHNCSQGTSYSSRGLHGAHISLATLVSRWHKILTYSLALIPKFDTLSLEVTWSWPRLPLHMVYLWKYQYLSKGLSVLVLYTYAIKCHCLFSASNWRNIFSSISSFAFKKNNLSLKSHRIPQEDLPSVFAIGSEMSLET